MPDALLLRGKSKTVLVVLCVLCFPTTAHAWKPERAANQSATAWFQDASQLTPLHSKSTCRSTRPGESYFFPGWWVCRSRVRHGGVRAVMRVYAHRGDPWGLIDNHRWFISVVIQAGVSQLVEERDLKS